MFSFTKLDNFMYPKTYFTPAEEGERGTRAFRTKKVVNAKKTNPTIYNVIFGN